jgi:hypothetical protein
LCWNHSTMRCSCHRYSHRQYDSHTTSVYFRKRNRASREHT